MATSIPRSANSVNSPTLNGHERTWTEATTEKLGNVLHAAQDIISKQVKNASDVVHKVEESVSNNVGAAAETAKEYVSGAKKSLSRALSQDSLTSTEAAAVDAADNAGDPAAASGTAEAATINSPDLQPQQKRPRIYVTDPDSMEKAKTSGETPTGLEANLDPNLVGPHPTRLAPDEEPSPPKPTARFLGTKKSESLRHMRKDSNDVWTAPTFE